MTGGRGDGAGVTDVDPRRGRRHTELVGERGRDPLCRRLVEVEHGDAHALACEQPRQRGAEARSAARDHGDLPGELVAHPPLLVARRTIYL